MKRLPEALSVVGALLLVATAALHASGYRFVASEIAASSVAPFVKHAAPTLWLFFSSHLVVIALGAVAAVWLVKQAAREILVACAIVTAIDFLWVFSIAGLFAGSVLLAAASVCFLVAGWAARRSNSADGIV